MRLVKQAVNQFPGEQTFVHSLKLVRQKRDLVNAICGRARHYASRGLFAEARNQWDILRNIYPQYPGLDYELESLNREQQQALEEQARADSTSKTGPTLFLDNSGTRPEVREPAFVNSASKRDGAEVHNPPPPQAPKPEASPQSRPEARVPAHPVENPPATQALDGMGTEIRRVEPAAIATPDSKQPHLYRLKPQSDPPPDLPKRAFVRNRRQIAAAGGAIAALVLLFVAAQGLRSSSHIWTRNPPQHTPGAASIPASMSPAGQSSGQSNGRAPVVASNNVGKQDAATQAPAPEHARSHQLLHPVPVAFQSTPVPAPVRIDRGDVTCHTPCELKLDPGLHIVSFSAENQDPVEKEIDVPLPENGKVSVVFPVENVRIISDPPGLALSVDGQAKGETPLTLQLAVGEHRLHVSGKGLSKDETIHVSHDGFNFIQLKAIQNGQSGAPNVPLS